MTDVSCSSGAMRRAPMIDDISKRIVVMAWTKVFGDDA
jgi:hypothetical protein